MRPVEVFFSYAHEDESLRDELEKHLAVLKREGYISGWHDRQIPPGSEWAGEIRGAAYPQMALASANAGGHKPFIIHSATIIDSQLTNNTLGRSETELVRALN